MANVDTSIYGTDRPSPIPNPVRRRGEPVPGPTFEELTEGPIPAFLAPKNIDTDTVVARLNRHLNREKPELARFVVSTVNTQQNAIKFEEIRAAMKSGQLQANWIGKWRSDYVDMINDKIAPQWAASMKAGGDATARALTKFTGKDIPFIGTGTNLRRWTTTRAGELIVDLVRNQETAINAVLTKFISERPLNPTELSRLLRATIGHTRKQALAISRFRDKLIAQAELDGRTVLSLTEEGAVQRYSDRLLRIRADRIARTEISFSYNFASLEKMREATAGGQIGTVVKKFRVAQDERACPICRPLDGKVIGLEETFPGGTKRLPNLLTPPLHPSCRCTIQYVELGL